jgi:hypothetical protein
LTYFWGLFDSPGNASTEAAARRASFQGLATPEKVTESFEAERISELEGEFGLPGAGRPTEVDHLEYEVAGVTRKIRVINRGISLFHAETPEILRLHRFFSVLQEEAQ